MAIDVSFRDGYFTSAQDISRFNKNFLINEGVANDGLKVSQSAVPAMSVQVSIGNAYFYGTGTTADTMFEFYSDSIETVTIPTASAQARIDIVCCKVDASTGVASLVVVSGTPSGSPAVPATPASHYKLANVAVGAGVTTITNANITDTRRIMSFIATSARNQGLINGKIVPTVTSNNLTVAIKTLQDTDPTPTNPVFVWIGGVLRPITSALSFTRNAGTNSLNMGSSELATRGIDLFAYCQWNTTTNSVNLLSSRTPIARRMSDFTNSATAEKGVLGIVNYNSTDDVVNIGRFEATLSASASFNWSVPTYTNINLIQEPIFRARQITTQSGYKMHIIEDRVILQGIHLSATNTTTSLYGQFRTDQNTVTYPITYSATPDVIIASFSDHAGVMVFGNNTTSFVWRGYANASVASAPSATFFVSGIW